MGGEGSPGSPELVAKRKSASAALAPSEVDVSTVFRQLRRARLLLLRTHRSGSHSDGLRLRQTSRLCKQGAPAAAMQSADGVGKTLRIALAGPAPLRLRTATKRGARLPGQNQKASLSVQLTIARHDLCGSDGPAPVRRREPFSSCWVFGQAATRPVGASRQ